MICFRDKTFCTFYKECTKGQLCDRALTPDVIKQAHEWWGGEDAPICEFVGIPPECFVELA